MERIVLPDGFKEEQKRFLNDVMDEATGQPIVLTANPVSDDVVEGQVIFVTASLRVYTKINGVLYYYTLTAA